jgi:hypothetical protein
VEEKRKGDAKDGREGWSKGDPAHCTRQGPGTLNPEDGRRLPWQNPGRCFAAGEKIVLDEAKEKRLFSCIGGWRWGWGAPRFQGLSEKEDQSVRGCPGI